jgi:hypothetical protein
MSDQRLTDQQVDNAPALAHRAKLHHLGIATDLRTTVVANMLQPISASVILDVSEDEPDLASPAGLECAVDDCDITPVIGCKLLHE